MVLAIAIAWLVVVTVWLVRYSANNFNRRYLREALKGAAYGAAFAATIVALVVVVAYATRP